MKSSVITMFSVLLSVQSLFAQQDNTHLLVQSPDGKTVKLIWFIKKWNSGITGFDIKRKEGLQDWVKLNPEPILPEVSAKKKLSIVESDKTEESRIKAKLYELLAARVIREMVSTDYMRMLNSDEKAVRDIATMISHDYDLALMNGFGYVDHTVTRKTSYQYGIFIQGTNKLLDSVTWNYGQIPDMNVVSEITSRATGSKGVQVVWNADMNKVKICDVAGFHIYRSGIRLNSIPIVGANARDVSEFTWNDESANSTEPVQYSISAESIFGIEGVIRPHKYDPAEHPKEYKKPIVTEVTSLGYYFKEGTGVKWTFPREYEHFLKGFYIEKDNMPEGYRQVYGMVGPSVRGITDTSSSQVSGYIRLRVIAVYNDRTRTVGTERVYNYFPLREPPVPQNLKAERIKSDQKYAVNLSWDPPMAGDTVTDYYRVYASDPMSGKLQPVTESKPIYKNNFTYIIDQPGAYDWKFSVLSVSKTNAESQFSDTVMVRIPAVPAR
jgi:hypothetical protein